VAWLIAIVLSCGVHPAVPLACIAAAMALRKPGAETSQT
jgi:hypothetical protein